MPKRYTDAEIEKLLGKEAVAKLNDARLAPVTKRPSVLDRPLTTDQLNISSRYLAYLGGDSAGYPGTQRRHDRQTFLHVMEYMMAESGSARRWFLGYLGQVGGRPKVQSEQLVQVTCPLCAAAGKEGVFTLGRSINHHFTTGHKVKYKFEDTKEGRALLRSLQAEAS